MVSSNLHEVPELSLKTTEGQAHVRGHPQHVSCGFTLMLNFEGNIIRPAILQRESGLEH